MPTFDPNKQRIPDAKVTGVGTGDNRRQVLLLILGSGALAFFANTGEAKPEKRTENVKMAFQSMGVAHFVVVYIALAIMADFDTTAELALVFAWLVFIAVALFNGPAAFKNIQTFLQPTTRPAGPGR